MLQKKICMLGSYGVGKTSLVGRFIEGIFSEKYLSTIGVKVDRKVILIGETELKLILWDLHGDDEYQRVRTSYLRGMAGYVLVVDGTRAESLSVAIELHELARQTVGDIPFLLLINKSDLADDWEVDMEKLAELESAGWTVHQTSAKTGKLVNESFQLLAEMMTSSPN